MPGPERVGASDRRPARSDSDARKRFLRPLTSTIQTVCATAQWQPKALQAAEVQFSAEPVPKPLPLHTKDGGYLYLHSTITFDYIAHADPQRRGERKVRTLSYIHTITRTQFKEELYAWHWHPWAWSLHPHAHIGGGKQHVPTGRVFVEQVVDFLIRDLNVEPRCENWASVLGENLRVVSKFATWGGGLDESAG